MASAKSHGASELMFPAKILVMDALPLLGSGKIDYPALSKAVAEIGNDGPAAPEEEGDAA